ncbi:hypothetical protein [Rhizobium leguminosarum]|uniref:hypothetical protein n=1 Tax=Rhizobium leguminosarum TaxID=384 RepID=UPI0014415FE8|nr:hypothetical protein [Rhizobium leguminosarum]NKM01320.1 hypothetical protein [Rhizobium leguminosarum bv. viciae]
MDRKVLSSVQELLFEAPLYETYAFNEDLEILKRLSGRANMSIRIDAHCPYCNKETTWTLTTRLALDSNWHNIKEYVTYDDLAVTCGRNDSHKVRFYAFLSKLTIEKIGQYPSLATIANDETSTYRALLSKTDANEFHKAIGLAAHGVGVGSFVYLRRVFENLVYGRFTEFKESEGWSEDDFKKLRMNEKIDFLRDHLPNFLVEHSRIYSILSVGIHELSEQDCLRYFNILKQSIVIVLEEDKKKKEELALRKQFSAAINQFEA